VLPFSQEFGRQLLEAVAYMHELKLVHTDLKPEVRCALGPALAASMRLRAILHLGGCAGQASPGRA
jgi:hypothetical protein